MRLFSSFHENNLHTRNRDSLILSGKDVAGFNHHQVYADTFSEEGKQ